MKGLHYARDVMKCVCEVTWLDIFEILKVRAFRFYFVFDLGIFMADNTDQHTKCYETRVAKLY
jgi:hypothetical protein